MSPDHRPAHDSPIENQEHDGKTGRSRKRWILGGGIAAGLVVTGIVAASLLAVPEKPSNSTGIPVASASASLSANQPPKSFPPFDRAEYSQAGAGPAATDPVEPTSVTVSGEALGTSLVDGLMGLSIETDSIADVNLDPANSTLADVLKMAKKPVIRFGGQSVDRRFFWTSSNEPLPGWVLVPAFNGDVRPIVRVQPADLERLKRLLDAADGTVLLSVDMGHVDPARAADFAVHAQRILGSRLLGVSLGNEPNGYTRTVSAYWTLRGASWNFDDWAGEAKATAAAIAAAAPTVKIVGPEVYSNEWWKQFAALGLPNVGALSYHHYPLPECPDATKALAPSIARAMSRELADSSAAYHRAAATVAKSANIPAWLTESGISSCGGANETTKRHVSALWTVNYALSAAKEGISQVDLHSSLEACKGGPPLSPICDSGAYKKPNGRISMHPAYYGMMLVNGVGAGKFQKTDIKGNENVYAYAVSHDANNMSVIVVNQNDPASKAPAAITVKLPKDAGTGTMLQMSAPAFDSEDQTRIDGLESAGVPAESRARIPGFAAGSDSINVTLTSGTATVLRFTF